MSVAFWHSDFVTAPWRELGRWKLWKYPVETHYPSKQKTALQKNDFWGSRFGATWLLSRTLHFGTVPSFAKSHVSCQYGPTPHTPSPHTLILAHGGCLCVWVRGGTSYSILIFLIFLQKYGWLVLIDLPTYLPTLHGCMWFRTGFLARGTLPVAFCRLCHNQPHPRHRYIPLNHCIL